MEDGKDVIESRTWMRGGHGVLGVMDEGDDSGAVVARTLAEGGQVELQVSVSAM